jgi:exonuclease III
LPLFGQAKSGVSIMYKKNFQFSVIEIIDIDSTRIIDAELKRHNRKSLFIIGVYLPSDSNIQSYCDEINLLEALYNHYSEYGDVLIGGDFNASLKTKDYSSCNLHKSSF